MTMPILGYLATLVVFTIIDLIWLLGPGRSIYSAELGPLMRSSPNLIAGGAFYLIYCAGLMVFAIDGAFRTGSPVQALVYGAGLGLVAYATYDLTNLAVVNGFSSRIAIIDLAWGTVLSGVTAWFVTWLWLRLYA